MTQSVSVIVALLLVTPLVYLRLVGRAVHRNEYLTLLAQLAFATVFSGVLLSAMFSAIADEMQAPALALAGAVCAIVLLASGTLKRWQLQHFIRAVKTLRDGGEADIEPIEKYLRRSRPRVQKPPSLYATHVLYAVAPLLAARHCAEVERLLELLPIAWLTPTQHASYINALMVARLGQGDVAGAKKALAEAPQKIEDANQRRQLELLDALCASLTGDPDRALELLAAHPVAGDPVLPHLARAHALAASGDLDGARVALRALHDAAGNYDAAIDMQGPATHLAESLRAEVDSAYR